MLLSPWLDSLPSEHKQKIYNPAVGDSKTDIVIVGGGIAGAATLFQILEKTNKNVVLLEGEKIAHGATGHNAGQVTAMLENDTGKLVATFGAEKVRESFLGLNKGWEFLEEILQKIGIKVPYWKFIGYRGFQGIEPLVRFLKDDWEKKQLGLEVGQFFIHPDFDMEKIPVALRDMCTQVSRDDLYDKLQTKQEDSYIAAVSMPMGVMNSAHFTTEIIAWCVDHYKDRVVVYEKSPVRMLELSDTEKGMARVVGDTFIVNTQEVVLCTNGFEHFSIHHNGINVNTKFHEEVHGVVGYMAGYEYPHVYEPSANSYINNIPENNDHPLDKNPYDYITRRPFEIGGETKGLLVAGGPESQLISHRNLYDRKKEISEINLTSLDGFVNKTAKESALLKRIYAWHGLMGYTKSGVRLVGKEPCAPGLWYNLGCNGIGILSSVYGGERVARLINGEVLPKTMFDPVDARCL